MSFSFLRYDNEPSLGHEQNYISLQDDTLVLPEQPGIAPVPDLPKDEPTPVPVPKPALDTPSEDTEEATPTTALDSSPTTTASDSPYITPRANATLLMLARNNEVETAANSVRELEDKFNKQFGYPWVFLNEVPFSDEFKE